MGEKKQVFSLDLESVSDRNIAQKLRDNVTNHTQDSWSKATLNGKEFTLPKNSKEYSTIVIPEKGQLKFQYIQVGKNKFQ